MFFAMKSESTYGSAWAIPRFRLETTFWHGSSKRQRRRLRDSKKVNANEEGDETYDVMLDDQLVEEESQDEAKQPEAGGSLKSNLTREQVQRDDKTDDGDNCSVLVGRDDGPRSEHISAIWIPLESDPAFHALKEGDYPGAVLAKVEFFRETEPSPPPKTLQSDIRAQKNPDDFSDTQKNPDEFFDTLKVNVLRATDLPAADINSLSDPYIKMRLRSEIRRRHPFSKP